MVQVDYLKATLGLTVAQHWFDSWLNSRQLLKLDWKTIPSHLGPYFTLLDKVAAVPASKAAKDDNAPDPKTRDMTSNFLAAQAYLKDKLRFGQLTSLVDLAETTLIYSTVASTTLLGRGKALSGLKLLWDFAGTLPRVNKYGEIVHSLAFVVVLSLVGQVTAVPASLYRTFVLEEKASSFVTRGRRRIAADLDSRSHSTASTRRLCGRGFSTSSSQMCCQPPLGCL